MKTSVRDGKMECVIRISLTASYTMCGYRCFSFHNTKESHVLDLRTHDGEVAISHLLSRDAEALIKNGQEFRIVMKGETPFVATLTNLCPRRLGAYVEMVELRLSDEVSRTLHTTDIESITILPTRRMTNDLGYQQMCQMEHLAGLVPS